MDFRQRLLLLSPVPPCQTSSGAIVLDQLVRMLEPGGWVCFALLDRRLAHLCPSPDLEFPYESVVKPREHGVRPLPGCLGSICAFLHEIYSEFVAVPRLVRRVLRFARAQRVTAVWCVLEGQTSIRMANRVAKKLGVPLLTEVWDPPTWWLREGKVDKRSADLILRKFDTAIRTSAACAVASNPMAEVYKDRYGVKTYAFLPSLNQMHLPAEKSKDDSSFNLVLAGQIYASVEWQALLTALKTAGWRIGGRPISVTVVGRSAGVDLNLFPEIKLTGWMSQKLALEEISKAHVGYCPYWFSPNYKTEASLSFPSKVTSYLAMGVPVFFHGPTYASPVEFLKRHDAGIICHSLETAEILATLENFIAQTDLAQKMSQNARLAFLTSLTTDKLKLQLQKFVKAAQS